jgi:chitosanase
MAFKESVMLDELQTKAAQAIVVQFETGNPRGDYSAVTVIPGDSGHLTYGRLQTTLSTGNLFRLVQRYCAAAGARLGAALEPFLPRLEACDVTCDHDDALRALLGDAGEDPVMHAVQDAFFDESYWRPCLRAADRTGIVTALGTSTVFDGFIQGSWGVIADTTTSRHGTLATIGETQWVSRYVDERRQWLATHARADLRLTVYRMDAFRGILADDNWSLALPFTVRGAVIDEPLLHAGVRLLALRAPLMRGDDVRVVQRALAGTGLPVDIDGVYGPGTKAAVEELQRRRGLPVTGAVDAATRGALGI